MTNDKMIRLLMVDDEIKFLETITKRLKLKLFEITSATNGNEAIEAAKKGRFDVAVIDLQMPGIDGVQVLEILKKTHKYLEVIILSGHATIETAVTCTKLGAFKILEKPCDFDKLVDAIKESYEKRLKKKFEHDQERMKQMEALALGQSPLGILKGLAKMDKG
ncbi:MAG: response regulator [Desulfobacula sp.]|jgi:two-component system NtrC family response regulator|uniref:response regulator n=1 Tax=Desulfobacula sp. TaxID=2593537 RepID=UPI001EB29DDF|nr:response regulator [Desulfobacula sp.]